MSTSLLSRGLAILISLLSALILNAEIKPFIKLEEPIKIASSCTWRSVEASWYGDPNGVKDPFHGRQTASGSTFNTWKNTVAHKTLPFGSEIFIRSGEDTIVSATVTDRGPYISGREFDLSYALADAALVQGGGDLLSSGIGIIEVCY